MLSFGVILRLVVSTGVVVGALFAIRWWSTRSTARGRGAIRVIARAGVARSSAVAVIEVGARRYLIGAGEHSVNLLAELDPTEDLNGSNSRTAPTHDEGASVVEPRVEQGHPIFRKSMGVDGMPPLSSLRVGPRTGPLAHLRRLTTRVPREVRIHGFDH